MIFCETHEYVVKSIKTNFTTTIHTCYNNLEFLKNSSLGVQKMIGALMYVHNYNNVNLKIIGISVYDFYDIAEYDKSIRFLNVSANERGIKLTLGR